MKTEVKKTNEEILQNLYIKRVEDIHRDCEYYEEKLKEAREELNVLKPLIIIKEENVV